VTPEVLSTHPLAHMISMLFIVSEDYKNMPLHFVIMSDSRPAIASPFVLLNDITKPSGKQADINRDYLPP